MGFFNLELKELFNFNSEERPKVVADEIQATVEEAGKGRGLGVKVKKRKTPNFSLSDAGQNLYKESYGASYGASEEALAKQEELRKATESEGIRDILGVVMDETTRLTERYSEDAEGTLGTATYLTKEEKKQRSIVDYTVTKENPEFNASGLKIEQSYKSYKARGDYNPNYGETATEAATPFNYIVFHHSASGRNEKDDNVVAAGQRLNSEGEQIGYHFYIGRDLKIRQGAPLNKRTNHVGGTKTYFEGASKTDPTFTIDQVLAILKDQKTAFNENSIGIGFIAANDKDIDPKQIDLGIKLAEALSETFSINPENVGGHGHLDHQDKVVTEGSRATKAWRKLMKLNNVSLHSEAFPKYKPLLSAEDVKKRMEEILAFQRLHPDLTNDGRWGPQTKQRMEEVGYKLNE